MIRSNAMEPTPVPHLNACPHRSQAQEFYGAAGFVTRAVGEGLFVTPGAPLPRVRHPGSGSRTVPGRRSARAPADSPLRRYEQWGRCEEPSQVRAVRPGSCSGSPTGLLSFSEYRCEERRYVFLRHDVERQRRPDTEHGISQIHSDSRSADRTSVPTTFVSACANIPNFWAR